MSAIRVAVIGARGRMGSETVRAIEADAGLELVGAWDVGDDLAAGLAAARPEVAVELTVPAAAPANVRALVAAGVRPVVGTTGLPPGFVDEIDAACRAAGIGAVFAPNFALGAVLMMRFAREAARVFPDAEIIELHHAAKLDAPSGTAARTAELMREARGDDRPIPIHSVRLPGLVACQEVLFGATGQTLSIRHDTTDRSCFMPGVLLAVRAVRERVGAVRDLGELL